MHHAIAIGVTAGIMIQGFWSIQDEHPVVANLLILGYVVYGLIVVVGKSRKAGR